MSFLTPKFQVMSDLHLEAPLIKPQYDTFNLKVHAENLLLLGDIGLVRERGLIRFLHRTLNDNRGCRIFYILGNHELLGATIDEAYGVLYSFEEEARNLYGGRFKVLCRNRYDLDDNITILGCTLWSNIKHNQEENVVSRCIDFDRYRGIKNWSLKRHRGEHRKDLTWLNEQISTIERDEPHRQVIIATHHSPTTDTRACNPFLKGSSISSNLATDLSQERCWLSPTVKLLAYGHTHYNCAYRDEKTGKLVLTNQKGYGALGSRMMNRRFTVKVVKAGKDDWEVLEKPKSDKKRVELQLVETKDTQTGESSIGSGQREGDTKITKGSFMQRLSKRMQCIRVPSKKKL